MNLALVKRFGPVVVIVALVAAALASGILDHVSLDELKARRDQLTAFVDANWLASLAIFMGVYTTAVALSLPAALVLTLTSGFLFGPVVGALASVTAATAGSTVTFLAARTAFGDIVRRRAGPALTRLCDGFREDAFSYLLTLRIIPIAPLLLINVAAGLIELKASTFVVASLIGMAPGSFIYAWLGSGLGEIFERGDEPNLGLILQPSILGPLIGLGLLALLPIAYRRYRKGKPAP